LWSGKIVGLLLDHGVKLDSTSAFHKNSLLLAASKTQSKIIPLLLQHGISVNSFDEKSNTVLHIACANRYWYFAEILLDDWADIFIQNKNGMTASWLVTWQATGATLSIIIGVQQIFTLCKCFWTAGHALIYKIGVAGRHFIVPSRVDSIAAILWC
jgi:hypothetical protein